MIMAISLHVADYPENEACSGSLLRGFEHHFIGEEQEGVDVPCDRHNTCILQEEGRR